MAVLSDRTLRELIAAGRIVLDPFDESCIQPASIDVHLDRFFRVFLNHTMAVIDVKADLSALTQEIEVKEDEPFILHPGEFVLGSTRELIGVPDDLVARVEGKSSLGRLGLLIHSSLPGSETILVDDGSGLAWREIGDVVAKEIQGRVVSFDPETFRVGFAEITGWYEGPPDRIYEVELASGRTVRVTAGHNLFTLDAHGALVRTRTGELKLGTRVAIPGRMPPPAVDTTVIRVACLAAASSQVASITVDGPTVALAFELHGAALAEMFTDAGMRTFAYHRANRRLPLSIALLIPGLVDSLGEADRVNWRGGRNPLPARWVVGADTAWLLGLFVAEGYRRETQATWCNTDQALLDRVVAALESIGLSSHRGREQVVCGSAILSATLGWIGTGGKAPTKRVPPIVLSWPEPLLRSFIEGVVDGDGSLDGGRTSVWTTSEGLTSDLLVLFARLGRRSGHCFRPARGNALPSWQVYAPDGEHKLLTAVPLPDRLLVQLRREAGIDQKELARRAGYRHATDLNNIERRRARDAVRRRTLRRLRAGLEGCAELSSLPLLDRLLHEDVLWDEVVAVRDTGRTEPVFDLEVRPEGRKIENFVAGSGGVFVSNTAGFIDAGFSGHITLELSNVANLPITLYPGMKIGQISFLEMTTPADEPYGSGKLGSKYQGQRGPTPSRYWENFAPPADG